MGRYKKEISSPFRIETKVLKPTRDEMPSISVHFFPLFLNISFMLMSSVVFFGILLPAFPRSGQLKIAAVVGFLQILNALSFYLLLKSDPTVDRAGQFDMVRVTPPSLLRWCPVCNIHKDAGTYHCNICNNCILKYHHHCIFSNNCVGKKNYGTFLLSLITGIGSYGALLASSFNLLKKFFESSSRLQRYNGSLIIFNNEITDAGWCVVILLLGIISLTVTLLYCAILASQFSKGNLGNYISSLIKPVFSETQQNHFRNATSADSNHRKMSFTNVEDDDTVKILVKPLTSKKMNFKY